MLKLKADGFCLSALNFSIAACPVLTYQSAKFADRLFKRHTYNLYPHILYLLRQGYCFTCAFQTALMISIFSIFPCSLPVILLHCAHINLLFVLFYSKPVYCVFKYNSCIFTCPLSFTCLLPSCITFTCSGIYHFIYKVYIYIL